MKSDMIFSGTVEKSMPFSDMKIAQQYAGAQAGEAMNLMAN